MSRIDKLTVTCSAQTTYVDPMIAIIHSLLTIPTGDRTFQQKRSDFQPGKPKCVERDARFIFCVTVDNLNASKRLSEDDTLRFLVFVL